MQGLHHVHGDWLVDDNGREEYAEGDFWTLGILANRMGLTIDEIYARRRDGLFPTLRPRGGQQYLLLPAVGEAIVRHYLKHHMWFTFRVVGDEIVLYDEPYGSRARGRQHLAETGRLHEPPAGTPIAVTAPLHVSE